MLYRLFNTLCSIGVIWEDNLGCRTESPDINELKMWLSPALFQAKHLHTDLPIWGHFSFGRVEVFCGVLQLYNTVILYLSTQWRPTFVLTLWGMCNCLFPPLLLTCAGKSSSCFSTLHECCKHKNIMEIKHLSAVAKLWWFNRPLMGNKQFVFFFFLINKWTNPFTATIWESATSF